MKFNTYTKLFQQNINMERIKQQEIKKSSRNILRNNKNIHFEITKQIYLNYFCDNMKDIIIIEKLLLILDPLIDSEKILIHNMEKINLNNKLEINDEFNRNKIKIKGRGRTSTKEIRHTEINLMSEKNSYDRISNDEGYQSKNNGNPNEKSDLSVSNPSFNLKNKKKKKKIINTSPHKSLSPNNEIETRDLKNSKNFSASKINDKNLNSKKKRKKTNRKNKTETKHINDNKRDNLSEDKSYISDDNVEKNRLNFLQALQNMTKNMLLESKIKGEKIECVIEPQVIPDLEKILAESAKNSQRNIHDFSEQNNKELNLSNNNFDYNNISDRSNIYAIDKTDKILLSNIHDETDENQNNCFGRSLRKGDAKYIRKIKEDEVNKSIIMNDKSKFENIQKSDENKKTLSNRSGIYKMNDISNQDLSKENRLEFVSTNDKNEVKTKKKELSEKTILAKDINKDLFRSAEDKNQEIYEVKNAVKENIEIRNEDIILHEKIKDVDKIRTKNTYEMNSLGKNSMNIKDKEMKGIVFENNERKKRKNAEGCKCACSVF